MLWAIRQLVKLSVSLKISYQNQNQNIILAITVFGGMEAMTSVFAPKLQPVLDR